MQLNLCWMLSSSSYVCYGLYNYNLNPNEAVSFQHQRDDTVTNLQSEQNNYFSCFDKKTSILQFLVLKDVRESFL